MTNTTGVLHILTGTYKLLAMRRLNGQTAHRGLELHFPRYHYQRQPDQLAFQGALVTLLGQTPLEVNIDELVQYWPYFYEWSIGCVGVLKDWLVRSVHAALAEGERNLVFNGNSYGCEVSQLRLCFLPQQYGRMSKEIDEETFACKQSAVGQFYLISMVFW